jgi:hypothetical protein
MIAALFLASFLFECSETHTTSTTPFIFPTDSSRTPNHTSNNFAQLSLLTIVAQFALNQVENGVISIGGSGG